MPNTKYSPEHDMPFDHDGLVFWSHGGKSYMLHVEQDPDPLDPRAENDNLSVMACFHPRHSLGDELDTKSPGEFWDKLVRENFKPSSLLAKLQAGESKYFLQYMEDEGIERGDPEDVLSEFHAAVEDGEVRFAMDVLKDLYAWLPMYLYEHSGLTVSCGERAYPYDDRWDSSEIGWIVLSKAKALSELGAGENDWREKAEACMRAEVKAYDDYHTGNVWMYALFESGEPIGKNEYDPENGRSDENAWGGGSIESCGGFDGGGMFASGMADSVGHGLETALVSGEYYTGTAKPSQVTVWTYHRDV